MQLSDREDQLRKLDALSNCWSRFDEHRLRAMQQVAGVLKQGQGTLKGRNLKTLESLYTEFCGGDS